MADFSFSDDRELHRLSALVHENPEEFEHWNKLVQAAENQEGGLNRNSSPNAIAAVRETYDRFLARFPLFYAFWKRYADLEFLIAGAESAESVYERGIAGATFSIDLWTNYCEFKVTTCHDNDVIRELFERGAECIGLDFNAHPFWDKYLLFEGETAEPYRVLLLLERIVNIPLHQYPRYYEQYQRLLWSAHDQDLTHLPAYARAYEATTQIQMNSGNANAAPFLQELRKQFQENLGEDYRRVQQEVASRWQYEEKIKRPYYHVTELEEAELENWRNYLDFEEKDGNYSRIKLLYERCLLTAADYDEFWFRYARWMISQDDKQEEVRNIYRRASFVFVKISQTAIRHAWAKFEEASGRPDVAFNIHEAILVQLPVDIPTYKSMVNLRRRSNGLAAAIELLRRFVDDETVSAEVRGALVVEWARFMWQLTGSFESAESLFESYQDRIGTSHAFWSGWLQFEMDRPVSEELAPYAHQRISKLHQKIHTGRALHPVALSALAEQYIQYLESRGDQDAMKEAVLLDGYTNGPKSVVGSKKFKSLFPEGTHTTRQLAV